MKEQSSMKKEFSKRDVQRMRNIITGKSGDRTTTLAGWEKETQDYKEGDVWEENGKKWTIKKGIKQTVTKLDGIKALTFLPICCPECKEPMKDDFINRKTYNVHKMCLDCVIDMEAKIKIQGKWEDYEKNIINSNKNASLEDFEKAVEAWANEKDTFVSESGEVESWTGGDRKKILEEIKANLDKLKKTDIY